MQAFFPRGQVHRGQVHRGQVHRGQVHRGQVHRGQVQVVSWLSVSGCRALGGKRRGLTRSCVGFTVWGSLLGVTHEVHRQVQGAVSVG